MLNKIILVGRLTDNPEWHDSKKEGGEFATFTLAINQDPKQDTCEFIDCSCGTHLNNALDLLHKGDKIAICGKFSNRKFTRKDGSTGVSAIVYVDDIEFVDLKKEEESKAEPEPVKEEPKRTRRAK